MSLGYVRMQQTCMTEQRKEAIGFALDETERIFIYKLTAALVENRNREMRKGRAENVKLNRKRKVEAKI